MQESFLHYVWQFQYFDRTELKTTSREEITVFHPGFRNSHAGPDFSNARIRIGDIEWIGNVEIHVHSSDWVGHHHGRDQAYDNVILHVVWKDDAGIQRRDGSALPTLELKARIGEKLLLQYDSLIRNNEEIPCAGALPLVESLTILNMKERALMDRLEKKAAEVVRILETNQNDWEETCFQILCRNFGFKVNADPFFELARSLDYRSLMKHADKPVQVEAVLFGQAGMLNEEYIDPYFNLLKREYALLNRKFDLKGGRLNKSQWKFLRLRPANFPTIRLGQLAALLSSSRNIFSRLMDVRSYADLLQIFSVEQSAYWKHHYLFTRYVKASIPGLGKMSIDNMIINSVVPLMVAWGKSRNDQELTDRAIDILHEVDPEENSITRSWHHLGIKCKNAFDSQALIELRNHYCLRRRCLECSIGAAVIRPSRI